MIELRSMKQNTESAYMSVTVTSNTRKLGIEDLHEVDAATSCADIGLISQDNPSGQF